MRNKITILLLLVILGSTALFADAGDFFGVTGIILCGGCTFLGIAGLIMPLFSEDMVPLSSSDPSFYFGIFGSFTVIGIVLLITNANSLNKNNISMASAIEEDLILKHINFATNGKDTFITLSKEFS
jgi:hypothetical protein